MKKYFFPLIVGVLICVLVCLGFFLRNKPSDQLQKVSAHKQIKQTEMPFKDQTTVGNVQTNAVSKLDQLENKVRNIQLGMNYPIHLYGKVIDENNRPISGVKVECHIRYFDGIVRPGYTWATKEFTVVSDENGMFAIRNEKGMILNINSFKKEGYEFQGTQIFNFDNRPIASSLEAPKIFYGVKKSLTEPLIQEEFSIGCDPTGRPYGVDLLNRKLLKENITDGDFQILFQRPLEARETENYNWSVQLTIPAGGLIESDAPFMYAAPVDGYLPVWSLEMDSKGKNYKREIKKKFYLKSRNGKVYGRIEMEFIPVYRDKASVFMTYWLNPLGSRNLEYDSEKRISRELIQRVGLEKAIEEVKTRAKQ